jgi:serine/threonine-protein kinase HipA
VTDRADVRLLGRHAGELRVLGDADIPEHWRFEYAKEYVASAAPSLSVSLPLRTEPFEGAAARNWFCNLLPEGGVREAIERRLRLRARDDFGLLVAIGGECAGAVAIGDVDIRASDIARDEPDLETLLAAQGEEAGEGAWATLGVPHRLSLAGAQDKIAVVRERDGRLRLPVGDELSTHIVKPDSIRLPGLRDLEALGLALARSIGLDVVDAEPIELAGRKALLVARYDRVTHDGRVVRLHQEDFCQALGYPPELKYQIPGGPTLAACSALIRTSLRLGPDALRGFLDWVACNGLIANADAHAKNLALVCDEHGRRRLAPFYDLVPTAVIAESLVDREPALRIGAAARIDRIGAEDWRAFAEAAGYAPRFVVRRVAELAEAIRENVARVASELVTSGADSERMRRAVAFLEGNAERTIRELGARQAVR